MVAWQRPIAGWYTCNVDAAVLGENLRSFLIVLYETIMETFVAGCGGNLWGIVDPKIAEAMAFKEALSWLKKLAIINVFMKFDLGFYRITRMIPPFRVLSLVIVALSCKGFKILFSPFH